MRSALCMAFAMAALWVATLQQLNPPPPPQVLQQQFPGP